MQCTLRSAWALDDVSRRLVVRDHRGACTHWVPKELDDLRSELCFLQDDHGAKHFNLARRERHEFRFAAHPGERAVLVLHEPPRKRMNVTPE